MNRHTFEEIFSYPIAQFKQHLENDVNERILFSGRYGIGKTMFLDNFFHHSAKSITEKYEVYTLFPINYSVASNEDIIRYIKYDILVEFLKKGKAFNETHLRFLDTLPKYLLKNIDKIAAVIVSMVPKIGKDIVDVYKKIEELRLQFKKFHKEVDTSETDRMIEYLKEIENNEGSIYDNDVVTKFISNVIGEENGKEKILVLEDLDRLDPDHVFRILNVFAAHFSHTKEQENKNKFSFNKIILVCDYENIRHIFHHRYGTYVDFVGYIDKFYSTEVFFFDNSQAIKSILRKVFDSINLARQTEHQHYFYNLFFNNRFVSNVVGCMLEAGFINLRSIIKMYGRNISYHTNEITLPPDGYAIKAFRVPVIIQLRMINDMIGDYNHLHRIIQIFSDRRQYISNYESVFIQLIIVLSYKDHLFHKKKPYIFKFVSTDLYVDPYFDIDDVLQKVEVKHGAVSDGKPTGGAYFDPTLEDFWLAMRLAVEMLHNFGYIR